MVSVAAFFGRSLEPLFQAEGGTRRSMGHQHAVREGSRRAPKRDFVVSRPHRFVVATLRIGKVHDVNATDARKIAAL